VHTHGHLAFNEVSKRLLQLNVGIFPLALVAVPALVVTFLVQRNDMALWLASFIVLGIVIIGVHAYAAQDEALLTLRDSMPMYLASFVGAVWVYRSFDWLRPAVWAVTLGLLILNLFTAWHAMQVYPFQSLEQAFIHTVQTGESQEGKPSRGGYIVGIQSEAQMAQYLKDHVSGKNAVLADNAHTFGVILLQGRPNQIFDRIDKGDAKWNQILAAPYGKVTWMLLSRSPASGDLITRKYPKADAGDVAGLTPVFRTQRYTLLRVASKDPAKLPASTQTGFGSTSIPPSGGATPAGTTTTP